MKKMEKETVVLECHACGEELREDESFELEEETYCEGCYYDYSVECEECGDILHEDSVRELDDDTVLCDECHTDYSAACDHCGDNVHERNTYTDGHFTVCSGCYDAYYYSCSSCGDILHMDHANIIEGEAYCDSCNPCEILSHDEKLSPVFYGEGKLRLGVELEIDGDYHCGPSYEAAQRIKETAEEVYCKYDGSLNEGFEIVTHPATLDYHMNMLSWEDITRIAREYGYRSHDAGTCGLHVHMSRDAFGTSLDEQEKNIVKLIYIIERHWRQVKKFTRRTDEELNRWARSYLSESEREYFENIKEHTMYARGKGLGKYVAVNLSHTHTIELRLFRGTLKLTTLYATLQFCEALHHVVMNYDIESIRMMTWKGLVHRMLVHTKYPELKGYLKERNLI